MNDLNLLYVTETFIKKINTFYLTPFDFDNLSLPIQIKVIHINIFVVILF